MRPYGVRKVICVANTPSTNGWLGPRNCVEVYVGISTNAKGTPEPSEFFRSGKHKPFFLSLENLSTMGKEKIHISLVVIGHVDAGE
jgi:hypothetical protein